MKLAEAHRINPLSIRSDMTINQALLVKPKKKRPKKRINVLLLQKKCRNLNYKQFLRSEYWFYVKKKVLIRDGHKCVLCGSKVGIQVHHNSYKHHYNEHNHLKDLTTLCKYHHEGYHDLLKLEGEEILNKI